jgi:beta-lactamase regulating signal transducer with metallopeptidase domain
MLLTEHWQTVAEMLVSRMLNGVAEGLIIALCGWLMVHAVKRQSSSTRFAVWLAALLTVTTLPVLESLHPNSGTASASAFHLYDSWAVYLFVAWAIFAGAGLAKIAFGFWQLRQLRKGCVPITASDLHPALLATLREFGWKRRAAIYTSDKVRVPAAIGFIKPAIVIPSWAMKDLTTAELKAVILHELAHLHRWDDWTNLAQKIVGALLFFHPAVWWIGRGLAREREMACDDFVLAATSDHRGYAQCLVSVAEKSFLRRGLALAQAMAERMQLTAQRVARILEGARSAEKPATRVWRPALGLVTAVLAACLISLPHTPNLVGFEGADYNSIAGTAIASAAHSGAKPIPASFAAQNLNLFAPDEAGAKSSIPQHNTGQQHRSAFAATPIPAKLAEHESPSPQVINARADQPATRAGIANAVLVILRTEQIDASGRIWSVSVWQLTVYHPDRSADHETRKGVTPKST